MRALQKIYLPSVCKLHNQNKLHHYYYGTALLGGWKSDVIKEIKIRNNFVWTDKNADTNSFS